MKRVLLVALLVFALLVTLIACTGEDQPEETTGEEQTTKDPGQETTKDPTGETTTGGDEETTTGGDEETTTGGDEETTTGGDEETTTGGDEEETTGDVSKNGAMSNDTIIENGNTVKDGGIDAWLPENRPDGFNVNGDLNTVGFRGWAGLKKADTTIKVYGYQIDDEEPVWDESFKQEAEGPVQNAGGDSRYTITVDLDAVTQGKHTLTLLVKGENDKVYIMDKWGEITVYGNKVVPTKVLGKDEIGAVAEQKDATHLNQGEYEYIKNWHKLTSAGGDPYIALLGPSASEDIGTYIAFYYRTTSEAKGEIFAGSEGGWRGGDSFQWDYNNDGEWHLLVLDLKQSAFVTSDTIAYVRYDFFTADNGTVETSDFYFFRSEEDAKKYMADVSMWIDIEDAAAGKKNVSFDDFSVGSDFKLGNTPELGNCFVQLNEIDGTITVEAGKHANVRFRGWVYFDQTVAGLGYSIDRANPTWDNSLIEDRPDVAAAISPDAVGFTAEIPTADLEAGTHKVAFLFKLEDGTIVCFYEVTLVIKAGEAPTGETVVDADAEGSHKKHVSNDEIKATADGSTVTLYAWGWIALDAEFEAFGYKIDNEATVFDATWTWTTEDAVMAAGQGAGGTCISRFKISATLENVAAGEHKVQYIYKLKDDGTLVCFAEATVTVEAAPVATPDAPYQAPLNGDGSKWDLYQENWAAAGYDVPVALLGYGCYINVGNLDLSKFTKVTIMYGSDGSDGTKANYEKASSLAIGLKSTASSYGQDADDNFDGDIAHTNMEFGAGWAAGQRAAVVDLSNVDYSGVVYVTVHNPAGTQIAITSILFE